jgi:ATP-binding cassette subfamily B protein
VLSAEWRYYLQCYRASRWTLALTVLASIGVSLLSIPLIVVVKYVFDHVLPQRNFHQLLLCAALLLAISSISGAAMLWIRWTALRIGEQVTMQIRWQMLDRLYRLPREFFSKRNRMELHDTIVQDTQRVNQMGNTLIEQVLPALMMATAVAAFLLTVYWPLVFALLLVTPLCVWGNRAVGSRVKRHANEFRHSFEEFSKNVHFGLQAIDLTRIKAAENIELSNHKIRLDRLRTSSTIISWLDTFYDQTHGTLMTFVGLIILVVGGAAVANHRISLGSLISFYVAARILSGQTQLVLAKIPQVILGTQSLRDVYLLLTRPESEPYTGTGCLDFNGELSLEDVCFGYEESKVLFEHVCLRVKAHSTMALMGPNGSGKTSLVSILCGLYRPQKGRVLADGHSYETLDIRELRRKFGVVPQEPLLFPGTIRENIAYGCLDADMDEIRAASELATADSFISELERAYETPVGDGGMLLSGGQRQKIAIARALLGQPKVLILDEPTNHLDASSIKRLMANLERLPQRPTIIIVSHDKSVLSLTDTVYEAGGGLVILRDKKQNADEELPQQEQWQLRQQITSLQPEGIGG